MIPHNQNGFSLVEMLMTIIISSIILAAAFGSYAVINRNFEYQKDMKYISQTARMIVDMINEDVRMAGYKDINASAIADPVTTSDCPGGAGCIGSGNVDQITVIYDLSSTVRQRITYHGIEYPTANPNRYRLMKRLETCNPSSCNNWTQQYDEPVADYIEELTFVGTRGSCSTGGTPQWGCGNGGVSGTWIAPISATSVCEHAVPNPGALISSGPASNSIDGLKQTIYSCDQQSVLSNNGDPFPPTGINMGSGGLLILTFPNMMRVIGAEVTFATDVDGGNNAGSSILTDWIYPFAEKRSYQYSILFHANDNGCIFNPEVHSSCTPTDHQLTVTFDNNTSSGTHYVPFHTGANNKIDYMLFNQLAVQVKNPERICVYDSNDPPRCTSNIHTEYYTLADIRIKGEEYTDTLTPTEVETAVLIRSPNEHGNVDRANNFNGNVDRFLRDRFIGSTVIRNLLYQSQ